MAPKRQAFYHTQLAGTQGNKASKLSCNSALLYDPYLKPLAPHQSSQPHILSVCLPANESLRVVLSDESIHLKAST
jgi:hypothetical protein